MGGLIGPLGRHVDAVLQIAAAILTFSTGRVVEICAKHKILTGKFLKPGLNRDIASCFDRRYTSGKIQSAPIIRYRIEYID